MSLIHLNVAITTNKNQSTHSKIHNFKLFSNVKGYKVYDLMTKKNFISLDVVFHEEEFPFQHIDSINFVANNSFLDILMLEIKENDYWEILDQRGTRVPNNWVEESHNNTNIKRSLRLRKTPSYLHHFHYHMVGEAFFNVPSTVQITSYHIFCLTTKVKTSQ